MLVQASDVMFRILQDSIREKQKEEEHVSPLNESEGQQALDLVNSDSSCASNESESKQSKQSSQGLVIKYFRSIIC